MDAATLSEKLKVSHRAVVLHGELIVRNKAGLQGTQPHYLIKGVPPVEYNEDGSLRSHIGSAAGIEVSLIEENSPVGAFYGSRRASNSLQLAFGGENMAPSPDQFLVLRELGQLLSDVANRKSRVFAVVVPLLIPAQYGQTTGVFAIAGVFDDRGEALWVNPMAIETHTLNAVAYPKTQKHRTLHGHGAGPISKPAEKAKPSAATAVAQIHTALSAAGLKGANLERGMIAGLKESLGDRAAAAVANFLRPPTTTAAAPTPPPPVAEPDGLAGFRARIKKVRETPTPKA